MKTLKNSVFAWFVIIISVSVITSCSKQDDALMSQNTKVDNYLKQFYGKNIQLGTSLETKFDLPNLSTARSVESENIIITEVFVGNDSRARGYVISDKETNDFIYFIDVNRVDYKLTTYKVETDDTIVFDDINQLEKYLNTDELDYIKIAEDYNSGQSAERRFWGWQKWVDCDKATGMGTVMETYYVFGVGVKTRPIRGLDGGIMVEPCAGGALND
ncbi:MAG: hypothetical protein CFE23_02185 [Flavobacterium sp. BFFFF1]|uniref:hypothetical protein n=1 Tax=unclassified Flavobacterium TaxID=196869 RepID=UPI000BD54706|nr:MULTISPECIES: hypothetical protein [unclassified Flavobacterium]OYU81715.1 MAG: hypothetical protein CFE23_02185 [Flavobacterium sp. BFFFF1]